MTAVTLVRMMDYYSASSLAEKMADMMVIMMDY